MQLTVTEGSKVYISGRYAAQGQRPQRGVVLELDGDRALVLIAGTGIKVWRETSRLTAA